MAKYLKIDADGWTVLEVMILPDDLPAVATAKVATVDVPIGIRLDDSPITEKREVPVLDADGNQVVVQTSPYNTREMSAQNGKPFLLPVTKETQDGFDPAKQQLVASYILRDGDADIEQRAVDLTADEKAASGRAGAVGYLMSSQSEIPMIVEEVYDALMRLAGLAGLQVDISPAARAILEQRRAARENL